MTDQCSAEVNARIPKRTWRRCKYGALPGSTLCLRHTRLGPPKPKPPRCEIDVLTYSPRGYHQCYHASVSRIDGEWVCTQHAAMVARELAKITGREQAA